MNLTEMAQAVWRIPDELWAPLHEALIDIGGDRDHPRFTVTTRDGQQRVRLKDVDPAPRIVLDGRTRQRQFVELLEGALAADHVERRLLCEVDIMPGYAFELDVDDLARMAGVVEKMYGHRVRVRLTETGRT